LWRIPANDQKVLWRIPAKFFFQTFFYLAIQLKQKNFKISSHDFKIFCPLFSFYKCLPPSLKTS
jgi:hypothetical protein